MQEVGRIVYCHCAYVDVVPSAVRDAVLGKLCASGVAVEAVADLCELAARRDPRLKELAERATHVIACFPRAVRWLFAAGGVELPDGVEVLNMRAEPAEAIVAAVGGDPDAAVDASAAEGAEAIRSRVEAQRGGWVPWFPVIDRDRCKGCGQCVDFCLFGAFAVADDGTVEVRQPASCKTWCPACARVCPEVAIIFPKHKASPVNGGEVTEADERREKVAIDPSKLLQGDVYAALRARGRRFAADEDAGAGRAERLKRLAELREELGIPPEVIADLMADGPCACKRCRPDDAGEGSSRGCCE